jgi:hypothetical protein
MEKYDSTPFFKLGVQIGDFLKTVNSVSSANDTIFAAEILELRLGVFVNQNKKDPQFKHSINAANIVIGYLNSFVKEERESSNKLGLSITAGLFSSKNRLINAIDDFQTFLSAELPQINIFFVEQCRAYNMSDLINSGEKVLSPLYQKEIPSSWDEVVEEFREAGRSLAFGINNAVGLHVSRSVEVILRKDYFPLLDIVPPKRGNLGFFIQRLEKKQANQRVIILLNLLRDYYRNNIAHPGEFWDNEKAVNAFGTVINVIDVIVQDMQEIKKKIP